MSFRSIETFAALPISEGSKRALRDVFKYERLSAQQAKYMPIMLRPDRPDVFVKAGTGSGKTLGFLIPAVEALVPKRTVSRIGMTSSTRSRVRGIRVLILSPARELAIQTSVEAARLLSFHPGMTSSVVIGGVGDDVKRMRDSPPDVLVATPGRLNDLIEKLPGLLSRVKVVVLDEADRLLDAGFLRPIKLILAAMPPSTTRRTLLLSATVSDDVRRVEKEVLRPGYVFVDSTIGLVAGPANVGVDQQAVVCRIGDVHVELARILTQHRVKYDVRAKVLVFFNAKAMSDLYIALFRARPQIAWAGVLELHGGLAQNKRTKAMDEFRSRPGGVLFASDAAGRGIDIPNVTLVVQIGCAPADVYQQRVGRTGRAGAKGESVIILGRDETRALLTIKQVAPSITVRAAARVDVLEHVGFMMDGKVQGSTGLLDRAFKGALGAYKANAKALGWKSQDLVDAVAGRVMGMGMVRVPDIPDKTLAKMGLKGVSFDTAAIVGRLGAINKSQAATSRKIVNAALAAIVNVGNVGNDVIGNVKVINTSSARVKSVRTVKARLNAAAAPAAG